MAARGWEKVTTETVASSLAARQLLVPGVDAACAVPLEAAAGLCSMAMWPARWLLCFQREKRACKLVSLQACLRVLQRARRARWAEGAVSAGMLCRRS